jgi:flagellar biogenesis protein FliO
MNVVGVAGETIGTVERFELDRRGQISSLVVRIASSIGTRKRIAAAQIRSIRGSTVTVGVTADQVQTLADLPPNELAIDEQSVDRAS